MAYFLPSYFQKRLLRYALTRLDFIETDALNLEDLDITLGQRSVVELKNVGIRVKSLIERLQIPSSVRLHHASIRLLRITIPADLHISGIEVELDGIDVYIELQENDNTGSRPAGSASGGRDAANRSRIPSTSIHDPGGKSTSLRADSNGQHVIPTPRDLATSFLQSEPVEEREELEAAIQSQSHRLSDSIASLEESHDESGIGMPGGFSLPGFVAKFFTGVADRLSVTIKNVTASVAMRLRNESSHSEILKVMVKIASVSLEGLQAIDDMDHQRSQRSISISGFELFLVSEAETFSRPSATSSPKLAKSRSKMSYNSDELSFRRHEFPELQLSEHSMGSPPDYTHSHKNRPAMSSDGSTSSSQLADLSMDLGDPLLADSTSFEPSARLVESTLSQSHLQSRTESHHIDNRRHAEDLIRSRLTSSPPDRPADASIELTEDLAESKVFTHDQAESMYMSAVSDVNDMPGAWGSSTNDAVQSSHQSILSANQTVGTSDSQNDPRDSNLRVVSPQQPSSPLSQSPLRTAVESSSFDAIGSDLLAKRLVQLDKLVFSFPASISNDVSEPAKGPVLEESTQGNSRMTSQPIQNSRRPSATSARTEIDPTQSQFIPNSHARSNSRDFAISSDYQYMLTIGTVLINLDMTVSKMLTTAASQVNRYFPPATQKDKQSLGPQAQMSSYLNADHISLNLCQNLPELTMDKVQQRSSEPSSSSGIEDTCLLHLNITNLKHELAFGTADKRQRLVVNKIVLGHSSQKYLYFVDSFGMRDSVATSLMIKPDDLVMTNLNDRFEIQIKPVHVVVDLLKVDEVLSRSGGLSSILDLGNSIISTGTVTDMSSKSKPAVSRQRSVRFDSPASEQRTDSDASIPGIKVDVRISGAVLDLIGSESSIQIRSSAIKLVSRTGSFRAQIDTITLAGPVLGRSQTKPGISVKLSNFSLHFKDTPEEQDLDRLLSLLTPSGDRYDDGDDAIMVDTLLRQRRKGSVLRLSISDIKVDVSGITWLKHVTRLGDELARLATVTKYLPEDDRPGLLTFGLINKTSINVDFGRAFGVLHLYADLFEGAVISVPSLMAAQVSSLSVKRGADFLLGDVIPNHQAQSVMGPPVLMCRFIADEMEPTIRIKLSSVCLEYTVPMVIALTDLAESLKSDSPQMDPATSDRSSEVSSSAGDKSDFVRKVRLSLAVRDSAVALNPLSSQARALVLFSDAVVTHNTKSHSSVIQLDLRKASILIIDDVAKLGHESTNADHKLYFEENDQVQELTKAGYVPVSSISNAAAIVSVTEDNRTKSSLVDVEFRNNLFLLETCADSTQTLIQILSNLAPPSQPSPVAKYRTEIVPIQDMLASFTGNAFVTEPGPELGLQASHFSTSTVETDVDDDDDDSEIGLHDIYHEEDDDDDRMTESYLESEMAQSRMTGSIHIGPVNPTASADAHMDQSIMAHSMLDFRTDHFVHKSSVGGTAHRWNSAQNTYGLGSENHAQESPVKVRVRDVHIIWNLFDGYDWQNTRDTISQAVKDIEAKAMAKKPRRDSRLSPSGEDEESVIGDFLFNSIYIGIPANKDPRELAQAINQDLGDMASETGSYATGTTVTASPSGRATNTRSKPKKLRLNRSKQHKMTFELTRVSADVIVFPAGSGEVESSIDVRVHALEVFDHVPTSTWKKFATYMHEAGEREVDTNMVHLELLNVKPVADLAASEFVMKLTVLPLRLHVDQDALDFITRFFEFKDERAPVSATPSAPPFIQRAEVNPIRLRLDFKPKRVDYGGLRSGRTTEFMNFFVLDRSDMVLRRVILYGVSGFDRLGIMLNNIWTPDVKKNQLPGVLAGLAPIRSLVDVGSGVKDLVAVPIREYKKDGRIVRSIQKGAIEFARTTTTELVNLGAKLAIGTQTVLQNAEDILVSKSQAEDEEEEKEQISLYADQPIGIVQGLRGAYASLERDLLLARDAIVAVPGEVMASGSATGAAKAIIRQSPTIILRPAIGASRAVGKALLGAGNTLDKGNLRRIEDKYKHR